MTRAKPPRPLKVFRADLGFFRGIVAAPSQKAALEAWGTSRNLFAEGLAALEDDPSFQAEARAQPGEVVRKPLSDEAGYVAAAKTPRPSATSRKAQPKPAALDRSRLDAAEAAVRAEEASLADELAAIKEEKTHLDEQARRSKLAADKRLVKLRAERDAAEHAFREAGG